ncbi:hypothetical protein Tco_1399891 [Tanacetum coccineum]
MTAYTAYPDIQGIIYEDEMDRKRLMHTDGLHKFCDGTLNHVRTALNDIDLGIEMEYCLRENRVNKTSKELSQNWMDLPKDIPLDSVEVLRFNTTVGNHVKEILLKLNLPDHRSILTDSKIHIKMDMEVPVSS